jgi:hypothetical protein
VESLVSLQVSYGNVIEANRTGDGAMPKIGDWFKDKTTGKIYVVKLVDKEEVALEGEEGLGRRLTSVEVLKRTCEKLEDIKS